MTEHEMKAGCGFLSAQDLEQALTGTWAAARQQEFAAHLAHSCPDCLLLAADLELFGRVAAGGPLQAEKKESDDQAREAAERLKSEIRKRKTITS